MERTSQSSLSAGYPAAAACAAAVAAESRGAKPVLEQVLTVAEPQHQQDRRFAKVSAAEMRNHVEPTPRRVPQCMNDRTRTCQWFFSNNSLNVLHTKCAIAVAPRAQRRRLGAFSCHGGCRNRDACRRCPIRKWPGGGGCDRVVTAGRARVQYRSGLGAGIKLSRHGSPKAQRWSRGGEKKVKCRKDTAARSHLTR